MFSRREDKIHIFKPPCNILLLYSCKQYKNPVSNINFRSIIQKISFISTNYIISFELIEYLCIIFIVFSSSSFIFATKTCCLNFSFNKDENLFAALTKVAILKTKLLAGNDYVMDIFTSKDMENISLCNFSILPHIIKQHYLFNK